MNNTVNDNTKAQQLGLYRPKQTFYHPNGKGTGCAVSMCLHPAHDDVSGSIMMSAANQMTVGDRRAATPTFARFDWENAIHVKLDFNDLCKMLQVFRGECESIDDGHGLYHRSPRATTRILLRHLVEPVNGYSLELYRVSADGGDERRAHMLFTQAEAIGLCESICGSMYLICFGIPMLVPHDTSAYEAEKRGMYNATTAA